MWHAETKVAAMCHCVLATAPSRGPRSDENSRRAYVEFAFMEMLAFFGGLGIHPSQLEVKLFGGADVIPVLSGPKSVGKENINTAHRLIAQHGLRLRSSDVGGAVGRKIVFQTDTGSVRVHRMRSAAEQEALMPALTPAFA
jgi:chemotaxis protein CheD